MGLPWLHLSIFAIGTIPIFLFLSYVPSHELQMQESPQRKHVPKQNQSQVNQSEKVHSTPFHKNQTIKLSTSSVSPYPITIKTNDGNENKVLNESKVLKESRVLKESSIFNATRNASFYSSNSLTSPILPIELVDSVTHICPNMGHNLKLLVLVASATNHGNARLAIRETWGHWALRKDVAIAFMLGATSNKKLNDEIKREQDTFGDIIRGNFMDTFDNLAHKTIEILEWVSRFCPKALFVLKTDDDVFINVARLLKFVAKHEPGQRAIYGRVVRKWTASRRKKSKYYISQEQYKPRHFPDFATGPAYLFPARISKELHLAALEQTMLKLEDVYVTGVVANALKIKRLHAPEFVNRRIPFTSCNVKKIISLHRVRSFEQYDLWKKQHDVVKCMKTMVIWRKKKISRDGREIFLDALYFILNIKYPKEFSTTREFLQFLRNSGLKSRKVSAVRRKKKGVQF